MKNKYICTRLFAVLLLFMVTAPLTKAQMMRDAYFNIDWQLNAPVGNDFANKISGWGLQGEAGYFITPAFSAGLFVSYHTNNKFIDRTTIQVSETSAITSDQQHSIFQIPFGAALRYTFGREATNMFQPYVGAKVGTAYSEVSSYMNIFKTYERKWGFYVSPEIGFTLYPSVTRNFGFHMAAYYSYSTNKSSILSYSVDGLSNIGLRVGVAF